MDVSLSPCLPVSLPAGKKGKDIDYFYASCSAGEVARCGSGIEGKHIHSMSRAVLG